MRKKLTVSDLIAKHTDLEGTLRCPGDMMIDGHFKGEIAVSGTLVIGENATIEADIRAPYVVVGGDIYGNIIADQKVEIRAPGRGFGDIQAPSVVIEEGIKFEGRIRMIQAKEADERNLKSMESDEEVDGPNPPLGTIHGVVTGARPPSLNTIHDIITYKGKKVTGDPIMNAKVNATTKDHPIG